MCRDIVKHKPCPGFVCLGLAQTWTTGNYQPKYSTHVAKAFVACTLSGYVCFVGDSLYCGASSDSVIQGACGVMNFLDRKGLCALADGGFYNGATTRAILPFSKSQIWPQFSRSRLSNREYMTEAHVKNKRKPLFFSRSYRTRIRACQCRSFSGV